METNFIKLWFVINFISIVLLNLLDYVKEKEIKIGHIFSSIILLFIPVAPIFLLFHEGGDGKLINKVVIRRK